MLSKILKECNKEMQDMVELEKNKRDIQRQNALDSSFKSMVADNNYNLRIISSAFDNIQFEISEEAKSIEKTILNIIRKVLKDNSIDAYTINNLKTQNRKFNELLEDEWKKFYNNKTTRILNLLDAIRGIAQDKDKVKYASNKIKECANWAVVNKKLNSLCMGIKEANEIIEALDIDNNIIEFLKKVSSEEATLLDIDEKIIFWINKNELQGKIFISFNKKK
ncbi:hypothetical protein [Clostridium butyricum]|uniref:hypothetical protein n=1 Tax=Clostridium butyricum TaxID=1492 RepID=UPI00051B3A34|nr:hypothetical protein [Clostridium butyricum]QUF82105.1 hypothetical protein KDJ93_10200 [Clostridium butyricum]